MRMSTESKPFGRPTLYDPSFCEKVIELGRQGKSPVQMAAEFDVVRQTLYNWAEEHPDFLAAFTRARELSQVWFENAGQTGLFTPGFNAALWSKQMSARFREEYTDTNKQELSGPNGGPIPTTITVVGVTP
jgi:hypothetical protein